MQGLSWDEDGLSLGEFTMRSFGVFPSEERGSDWSLILEEHPHPKYYLSEKACRGILNRAKRKGRKLPKELEEALKRQCGAYREMESTEQTQPVATVKDLQGMSATP